MIKYCFFITASNENDDKLANCDVDNLVTINLHMNGRIYEVKVYVFYIVYLWGV